MRVFFAIILRTFKRKVIASWHSTSVHFAYYLLFPPGVKHTTHKSLAYAPMLCMHSAHLLIDSEKKHLALFIKKR